MKPSSINRPSDDDIVTKDCGKVDPAEVWSSHSKGRRARGADSLRSSHCETDILQRLPFTGETWPEGSIIQSGATPKFNAARSLNWGLSFSFGRLTPPLPRTKYLSLMSSRRGYDLGSSNLLISNSWNWWEVTLRKEQITNWLRK